MAPFKSSRGKDSLVSKLLRISSASKLGLGLGSAAGASPTIITGGTTVTPGNGYKYHTFLSDGSFVTTGDLANVDILMVAGGGGGGSGGGGTGGGGGAGGVRFYPNFPVAAGEYTITVGQGGNGAPTYSSPGTAGTPTTAFGKTATGGGHSNYNYTSGPVNGGSGAGVSYNTSGGSGNAGGDDAAANPAREGYNGELRGGGGAGANGQPNAGGPGVQFPDFTGPLIGVPSLNPYNGYYGGGGGSGFDGTNGTPGGAGGGGHGQSRNASSNGTISAGVDMLGGGGGGGSNLAAADGGNGIVVVRYQV